MTRQSPSLAFSFSEARIAFSSSLNSPFLARSSIAFKRLCLSALMRRLVLDSGFEVVFEEDEVEDGGFGFTADLVEAIERLIAVMAAFVLADTSFEKSCTLGFTLEVIAATGFGVVCIVVVLQV